MKELTRAEEEIMQVLWDLGKGFVKDVIERLPEPKPAYNTVSTILRILERKGFVDHKAYGKSHEYLPLVAREEYRRKFVRSFVRRFFGDSFPDLVSAFAGGRDMSLEELERVRRLLDDEIEERQKGGRR